MGVTRSEATHAPPRAESGANPPPSAASGGRLTPETLGLALVIAAGVVLRFVASSDLWLDEALSVNIADLPLGDLPDALRQDGHPPLYYALLHGWMAVVGDSDVAVRALSGVLAVVALPLIWLVGRRLGGPRLAWIATAFFAVLPYVLRYATETRMYSLVMLLVLVGYLLVDDALDRPAAWRLVAIAVISGALLLTHYWAMWLVGSTVLVLVVRAVRTDRAGERRASLLVAGATAAGGIFFVPWLPVFFDQMSSTGTPWASPVRPTTLVAVTLGDLGGGGGSSFRDAEVLGASVLVLVLLGVFARTIDARRIEIDLRTVPQVRIEAAIVALTIAIGTIVSYVGSTAYASRYAAVVVPLIVVIAAAGATRFVGRLASALVVGSVCLLALGSAVYLTTVNRTQAGEIVAAIEAGGEPGDLVVMCPDQLGPSVNRLLPSGFEQVTYPELAPPERVDWRDYAERHASADPVAVADEVLALAGDRRIWLVSSPGYKSVDQDCDVLRDSLANQRPAVTVVSERGTEFFEHASLTEYPAP
jgi:hypothetical protein